MDDMDDMEEGDPDALPPIDDDPDAAAHRHRVLEARAAAADAFNVVLGSRFSLTALPGQPDGMPPRACCCWRRTAKASAISASSSR